MSSAPADWKDEARWVDFFTLRGPPELLAELEATAVRVAEPPEVLALRMVRYFLTSPKVDRAVPANWRRGGP